MVSLLQQWFVGLLMALRGTQLGERCLALKLRKQVLIDCMSHSFFVVGLYDVVTCSTLDASHWLLERQIATACVCLETRRAFLITPTEEGINGLLRLDHKLTESLVLLQDVDRAQHDWLLGVPLRVQVSNALLRLCGRSTSSLCLFLRRRLRLFVIECILKLNKVYNHAFRAVFLVIVPFCGH